MVLLKDGDKLRRKSGSVFFTLSQNGSFVLSTNDSHPTPPCIARCKKQYAVDDIYIVSSSYCKLRSTPFEILKAAEPKESYSMKNLHLSLQSYFQSVYKFTAISVVSAVTLFTVKFGTLLIDFSSLLLCNQLPQSAFPLALSLDGFSASSSSEYYAWCSDT